MFGWVYPGLLSVVRKSCIELEDGLKCSGHFGALCWRPVSVGGGTTIPVGEGNIQDGVNSSICQQGGGGNLCPILNRDAQFDRMEIIARL